MPWRRKRRRRLSSVKASEWECSLQSGRSSATPLPLDLRPLQQLIEAQCGFFATTSRRWRNALSAFDEPVDVGVPFQQLQSNQLISLSWQYALLLPLLRAAHLVAHEQHRRAGRQQLQDAGSS